MPPTLEARTADRAIACLRKAIEELAARRPWNALAMVADAQDSTSALRGMIKGQISNDELGTHNAQRSDQLEVPELRPPSIAAPL